jgi:hypothetical protein
MEKKQRKSLKKTVEGEGKGVQKSPERKVVCLKYFQSLSVKKRGWASAA